jgi:predicted DsbA family dithiol-disulfide isomerase
MGALERAVRRYDETVARAAARAVGELSDYGFPFVSIEQARRALDAHRAAQAAERRALLASEGFES